MAWSTSPSCSASCFSAADAADGSGPTPWIARCTVWCTKPLLRSGASRARPAPSCSARPATNAHTARPLWMFPLQCPSSLSTHWRRDAVRPSETMATCRSSRRPARGSSRTSPTGGERRVPDDLVGRGRGPRAGHAARGLPRRGSSRCREGSTAGDELVVAASSAGCCRCAAQVSRSLAKSRRRMEIRGRHRVRRGRRRVRDPARDGGWIDDDIADGVHRAAPARVGALGGDLGGRRAGRRAVRRRDRRAVRRRVDVPPGDRRVEGGAGRPGGAALRRVRATAAARRAVADRAPGARSGWSRCRGPTTPARSGPPSRSRCRRGAGDR